MRTGDRVILTEDLEDLKEGLIGTVVTRVETFPFLPVGVDAMQVQAVQFDDSPYPCIGRVIDDKYIHVITKCKPV